jgi:hypothetical protein
MVNWNPNFPDVLGNEALFSRYQSSRVWAGAPARFQRLVSTATETISSLHLSAAVDTLQRASVPTVVDIVEEGAEDTVLFQPTMLVPSSDVAINNWRTQAGGSTNLFQSIDEDPTRWYSGAPAEATWIQNTVGGEEYKCTVDAAAFHTGGALVGSRVGFVEVRAILGANTGFRKLRVSLEIGGTVYDPAGSGLRDVHGYGATYVFWWGELNPATAKPWTPADIANFRVGGTSTLRVRAATATATQFPKVWALQLWVYNVATENRVAVGVWRRPESQTSRLVNVETDALLTVPSGAAGWSKLTSKNYLYCWRQTVSPAAYGAVVADDVRWNGLFQDLGPGGQPPGIVYPLHSSGTAPPSTVLASDPLVVDQFGRPVEAFDAGSRAAYGIALERSDAAISVDSQPYRLDISDLELVHSGQKLGQRVTPASSQSYLGVRLPIIPHETSTGDLTVAVHRVSDGVQIGGSFTITAAAARALPRGQGGIRYVTGFLSSSASLVGSTAYEIRLTSTSGPTRPWIAFMPDASLGPSASFGGTTDGAFIGATHFTDRDLSVNLIRQPDPPTGVAAAIETVQVGMPDGTTRSVEHVEVTWTAPSTPLGAAFFRYELERQLEDETDWARVANLNAASLLAQVDRFVPRGVEATYRVRQVALDGRISNWATSNAITPAASEECPLLLTSNHRGDLEVVLEIDRETAYGILSTERDEVVTLHGVDYQAVFMEAENRGVGWQAGVIVNFGTQPVAIKAGDRVFGQLLDIVRASDVPFVCAMDAQGTRIFGHVTPSNAVQRQPGNRYTATLDVIPTHTAEVPVEVSA